MTNDKNYHMILVIIIVVRGENMLQRALGSGWAVLLPGILVAVWDAWSVGRCLAWAGRGAIDVGIDDLASSTTAFVLLPSCVALISGIMLMMLNLKLMG
jgi:hypothetical protein